MAGFPQGMILFLGDDAIKPGCRLMEIKITNSYPQIGLSHKVNLSYGAGDIIELIGYEHITIPHDYRLHLTNQKEHLFFNVARIWEKVKDEHFIPFYFFTLIGSPAKYLKANCLHGPLVRSEVCIISPIMDTEFNLNTRFSLEFFLHPATYDNRLFETYPFAMKGTRSAHDNSNSIVGPFPYGELPRKNKIPDGVQLSMRMGYIELEDDPSMYLHTPLDIYETRSRLDISE